MLFGCSSGLLKDMGDFDRTGTPFNYMLAGWYVMQNPINNLQLTSEYSPTLVASLWDVTDKDLDKFTQSVFDKLRLTPKRVKAWKAEDTEGCASVVTAVAESREVCKLPYMTGAAPVVYGIPFYL